MSQASRVGSKSSVVGDVLIAAAILVALVNNDTYQWAIGVPIVLAVLGAGLRIEAAVSRSRIATYDERQSGASSAPRAEP